MQVYFYDTCQNPTGSNCMVLHENAIRKTLSRILVIFPFSACRPISLLLLINCALCKVASMKKKGLNTLWTTHFPIPKRKKDINVVMWCLYQMWVHTERHGCSNCLLLLKHTPGQYGWSVLLSDVGPGAELWTLNPLECTFPFFLDSWTQHGLFQKHVRQRSLQSKVLQLELYTKVLAPLQPLRTNTEDG